MNIIFGVGSTPNSIVIKSVSDITLSEEYGRAIDRIGLTLAELAAIDRHALDVAFADKATLAPLRAELADWLAARPEPNG